MARCSAARSQERPAAISSGPPREPRPQPFSPTRCAHTVLSLPALCSSPSCSISRVDLTLPLSFTRAASLSSSSFRLFALGVVIAALVASPSFFSRARCSTLYSTRFDLTRLDSTRLEATRPGSTRLDSVVLGQSFSSLPRLDCPPSPFRRRGSLLSPLSFSLSSSNAHSGIACLGRSYTRLLWPSSERDATERSARATRRAVASLVGCDEDGARANPTEQLLR